MCLSFKFPQGFGHNTGCHVMIDRMLIIDPHFRWVIAGGMVVEVSVAATYSGS